MKALLSPAAQHVSRFRILNCFNALKPTWPETFVELPQILEQKYEGRGLAIPPVQPGGTRSFG